MQVDAQTFRDLEIFTGREGRPGLFALLDRARTREGASVLRRRFRSPPSALDEIAAVQGSIAHIVAHRAMLVGLPGQYAVSAFEHYFHWHFGSPASAHPLGLAVDILSLTLAHYRERQRVSVGVRETARIIRFLREVAETEEMRAAPGELGALVSEISALVGGSALGRMRLRNEERWGIWRILRADRVFRREAKEAVRRLIEILFELDALVSMADATTEYGLLMPQLLEGPTRVSADGIVHLFLHAPVPNPLELGRHESLLFLTGPNMAGKTTYLRACGIAVYLAHLGMGVPAASFAFAPADALITAISLSDDVRSGISFFQAEALRARTIAETLAAGRTVVAIMDEPFKGTNVKDALDASEAFLSRLAVREGSLFIVASHLIEAGERLAQAGNVKCLRFEAAEGDGPLRFDFVLKHGLSSQRLGMRVLEQHGVFELLDQRRNGDQPS